MSSDMIERMARGVCSQSTEGFCKWVGGSLGCKVGRGEAGHWSKCVANSFQLLVAGHTGSARAALEAMREPSDAMIEAFWDRCDIGGDLIDDRSGAPGEMPDGHIRRTWSVMVNTALAEQPQEKTG